jgi:hypothetical protein
MGFVVMALALSTSLTFATMLSFQVCFLAKNPNPKFVA